MAKVVTVTRSDGSLYGHAIRCPACNDFHVFHARMSNGAPGWHFDGNLELPTFSPSLMCQWRNADEGLHEVCHSFVRDGRIEYLSDCTHALAGQTVELPEID